MDQDYGRRYQQVGAVGFATAVIQIRRFFSFCTTALCCWCSVTSQEETWAQTLLEWGFFSRYHSSRNTRMCAKVGKKYFELLQRPNGPFVPFILEIFTIADITDSNKTEISTLAEFIFAQSTDGNVFSAFDSFRKPNACYNLYSDGQLVGVYILDGRSYWVVPASIRHRFFQLCLYSLSVHYSL